MAVSSPPKSDWWSSWISTAREKSVSALNATKRDLAEFVSVLGSDTKAAVKGASNNINKIIVHSPSTSTEEEKSASKKAAVPVLEVEETAPYDRCQAELFSIQNNTDTYLQDPPHGMAADFEKWRSTFDIQSYQSDISNLLVSCSVVRAKHSQLVPAKVSYETFWMRYFYKTHLLEKEERQRADLMARASNRSQDQLKWDEEVEAEEVETEDVIGTPGPVVFKVEGCGHQRSESSTDSFVCVSEETGLDGDGVASNREMGDTESWEQLGSELGGCSRGSRAKLSEVGDEDSNGGGLGGQKEECQALLQSIELITAGDASEKNGDDVDSSSSDWEKWDD